MRPVKGTEHAWCDTCRKQTKQRTTTREVGRTLDQPMPFVGTLATKYVFQKRYKCLECGTSTTKEKDSYRSKDYVGDPQENPFDSP